MEFIKGKNRNQIEFFSLEDVVDVHNEVRLIDLFVDALSLAEGQYRIQKIDSLLYSLYSKKEIKGNIQNSMLPSNISEIFQNKKE